MFSEKERREYGLVLCHHGVLGQKWGVRRYQNEDGSLTKAGQEHYRSDKGANKVYSELTKAAYKIGASRNVDELNKKMYSSEKVSSFHQNFENKRKRYSELEKKEKIKELSKKANASDASNKDRLALYEANKRLTEAAENMARDWMGETIEEIYRMPKKERAFYMACAYAIMNGVY